MLNAITTKLEVDVMQASELDPAFLLASTHSLPAVVVHPQLVQEAILTRVKRQGRFKILSTIDWPKGELFGMTKMRGLTRDMMSIDGYEILMTGYRNENETRNEARVLTEFIKSHLSPTMEIRFVLGALLRDDAEAVKVAKVMRDIQAPAMLRTDTHLKIQVTKANVKTHNALLGSIKAVCGLPIKVSGNIDSVRVIAGCLQAPNTASRFAVSLLQLQAVVKELHAQPDELRDLLQGGPALTAVAKK